MAFAWGEPAALFIGLLRTVIFQVQINIRAGHDEPEVVDATNTAGVSEFDTLAVTRDPELPCVQASEHDRDVVHFVDELEDKLCPVPNDKQGRIGVVEERDVQNTAVCVDKLV